MHGPIIVMDRMNPGTPHKLLVTPGMKCKSEERVRFRSTLHKYNQLMVVVERNWIMVGKAANILISFWDLRDEPCLFKEHNVIDMIPSEIVSEKELGEGCRGEIYEIDIKLSSAIMAVNLVINLIHPEKKGSQSLTLLYRINTTEPSLYPDVLQFVNTVKIVENSTIKFFYPVIFMNEKYLICPIVGNAGRWALEVNEIDTLLSGVDIRMAPRKVLPLLHDKYMLEPGMSDRLAVFDTDKNLLTILDLVSTNPITTVDTIQCRIIGQPSEKYDLPDKKLKITNIDGIWCCGSFLILQRLELPNTCNNHRRWTFKLNIVDPGTGEKRPEVISQIKDIFASKISYPRESGGEKCNIDVMGIVYMVSEASNDVNYLTVNCAQFQNINVAQARCIGALDDSSSDNLGGSNNVHEVVNCMGKNEDRRGDEEDGEVEEETEGKEKKNKFYPGNLLISFTFFRQTLSTL
jgi:hypothetical protein